MTTGALLFMLASWTFVLGLTLWSFYRLMKTERDLGETAAEAEAERTEQPAAAQVH